MNQIIIVGNGFDLAHGFPTRYSDFMLSFLKDCIRHAYDNAGQTVYFGPIQINCRAYIQEGIENVLKRIDSIKKVANDHWIDLNITSKGPGIYFGDRPRSSRKVILFHIDSDLINELLSKEANLNWIDIEKEYFKLLNEALDNNNIEDQRDDVKKLNEDLDFLKDELCKYLDKIQSDSSYISTLDPALRQRIQGFLFPKLRFKNVAPEKSFRRLILNYNYTSTIQPYLEDQPDNLNTEISYIHGSLNDQASSIVFGFGSVDGPELKKILTSEIYQAAHNLKFQIYLRNGQDGELNKILKEGAFLVRVIGHSCGTSDGSTLRDIFEHDNCQGISVCYLNNEDFSEKTFNIHGHLKEFKKLPIEAMNDDLCFQPTSTEESAVEVS
ncbi:AbiH family protein [Roseivirga sp. E12]|uniref:AbiH family protein n=1 Tax=Roseivirga sp. E12 TaxID=2819237 RepID=UPI001ABCD329|nr:AbiH family protein [Roseivirga sp. E12]MBO3697782.1 hypothetical protein [Roseivirga sp. E12]